MILVSLIALPFLAALICAFARPRAAWSVSFVLSALTLAVGLKAAYVYATGASPVTFGTFLRMDALSAFFVVVIAFVNFSALIYSRSFLEAQRAYYILFNLFASTMLMVPLLDNLGAMWVAVELTTLVSAFLVGYYNTKTSVEAAWKYLIICSVGITLALLGTVFFYYAAQTAGIASLNWSVISAHAAGLDHRMVGIAFLFILVGYGTKAGLAPMHTWLPDAHSQALTPVSALLSGVLLKTSLYAIIRFAIITNQVLGPGFSSRLFLLFGLVSVAIAAIFLLVQKDIKRFLAYSSIEHIGIIVFGLGIGTPLAIFGSLFHILNHAMAKSLMFFSAGHLVKRYKSHNMHLMKGAMQALPFAATAALLGLMALGGMPPFGMFMSKFIIFAAAFEKGFYWQSAVLLFFLSLVFGALVFHLPKVIFGNKPKDVESGKEPFGAKVVFTYIVIFLLILGLFMPSCVRGLIESAAKVITGA